MSESFTPFVSVIIPVYNDPKRLERCLRALENQTYAARLYEIIVVDNASNENIEPIVRRFPHAQATHESRPSQFAARNAGFALARGEVIAFTDADCIPSASWIERGVATLQRTPNCGLVAGRIDIFFKDSQRPTGVELYEGLTALPQKKFVTAGLFGATANLFTFRSVFDRVGLFDDETKSGGDVEWGQRVSGAGYTLMFADDAYVAHPARYSLRELYKVTVRKIGGVHFLKQKRQCYFLGIDRNWLGDLLPPIRYSIEAVRDSRLKSPTDKVRVILVIFFVRYVEAWERLRLKFGGTPRR
ncbi:MAG: glycosyltransferase [Anaerolineae bacterium]|nr:glycosyltransferase [Gemmatimonadaceae bacterium]